MARDLGELVSGLKKEITSVRNFGRIKNLRTIAKIWLTQAVPDLDFLKSGDAWF